jgi:hypothetical protein
MITRAIVDWNSAGCIISVLSIAVGGVIGVITNDNAPWDREGCKTLEPDLL